MQLHHLKGHSGIETHARFSLTQKTGTKAQVGHRQQLCSTPSLKLQQRKKTDVSKTQNFLSEISDVTAHVIHSSWSR